MKYNIYKSIGFSILSGLIFVACSSNSKKSDEKMQATDTAVTVVTDTVQKMASQNKMEDPGKAVFINTCVVCHQANASGVPGNFPPLDSGSWVGREPTELIKIVLQGLKGEIEVKGEKYKNAMPPQAELTDNEIASVLSYIRSNFGNNFDSITPEMVKKVRAKIKK